MGRWEVSEVGRWERLEVREVGRRWEGGEVGRVVRWERWEDGVAKRWEVPGFIQGWKTQAESRISSVCF